MKDKIHRKSHMTLFPKKLIEHHALTQKGLVFTLSTLFYLSFTFYLLRLLQIEQISFITIISVLFFKILLSYIDNIRLKRLLLLTYSTAILILFIFTFKRINAGFLISLNEIFDAFGRQTGILIEPYLVTIEVANYTLALNLFWFILLHFISLLSVYVVAFRKRILLIALMTTILIASIFTQLQATIVSELVLLFTFIILIIFTTISEDKSMRLGSYNRVYIINVLFITIVVIGLYVGVNVLNLVEGYEKAHISKTIEHNIKAYAEEVRFEKEPTNTLTKGNLNDLKDLKLFDKPALEVIMDEPASMYLKGFVGTSYEDNQWIGLDEDTTYEGTRLVHSLNESKLNVFNQLYTLANLANDDTPQSAKITINNINANSKYIYYPYELKTDPHQLSGVQMYADYELSGKGMFGERIYQYDITPNLVTTYPDLANKLYQNEEEMNEYLLLESHYNEFVYEQYVNIPDYIELLIENHFEFGSEQVLENRLSYEVAINEVKEFLYRKIKYNEQPPVLTNEMDFVVHFLEGSREGFSSHYATVATLMFRYLGIPARYVEGFLVTPEDIKDIEPYEKVVITGENAHAWPEIYIDRIGWIPIEVTPPYYDRMLAVDLSNYPDGSQEESENETDNSQKLEDDSIQEIVDEDEQTRNDLKQEKDVFPNIILITSIAVVLLLLCLFIYLIKKRIEIYKRKNKFKQGNRNEAVIAMFSYIVTLIEYDGIQMTYGPIRSKANKIVQKYSNQYSEQFEMALQVNEKALYSKVPISEEEFNSVNQLLEETVENIKGSRNLWQKFKMKYIHFIY